MQDFKEILLKYKLEVEEEIERFFSEQEQDHFNEILKQFILTGGKRFRPLCLYLAYKGFGGKENILRQALSVEFFHNSTLIIDDIMDEDELRRHHPTVYKIIKDEYLKSHGETEYDGSLFNKKSSKRATSDAIMLGLMLYTYGGKVLYGHDEALHVYNEAFYQVNKGQMLDVGLESKIGTEQEYIDMANRKTAWLVAASLEIGAIIAGASLRQIEHLKNFGMKVALAFQIKDDLIDITPSDKKGRELGTDIKSGKKTLVAIKTLKRSPQFAQLLGTDKVKEAIIIMHETGAFDECLDFCSQLVKEGINELKKANMSKECEELFIDMADFLVNRDH